MLVHGDYREGKTSGWKENEEKECFFLFFLIRCREVGRDVIGESENRKV